MPKKYYVVKRGHHAGVYYSWSDCQKEVTGFPGAIYKGFATQAEAEAWYGKPIVPPPKAAAHAAIPRKPAPTIETLEKKYPAYAEPMDISCISYDGKTERIILPEALIIYTDGSCLVNPNGPGGLPPSSSLPRAASSSPSPAASPPLRTTAWSSAPPTKH